MEEGLDRQQAESHEVWTASHPFGLEPAQLLCSLQKEWNVKQIVS